MPWKRCDSPETRETNVQECNSAKSAETTGARRVNIFDLDFGVQVDSVKQRIMRNSVNSGNMSHRWTSALNDHFDY